MSAAPRRLPVLDAEGPTRPATRGDCVGGERPCPWVSCSHHLLPGHIEGKATHKGDTSDEALLSVLEAMPDTCELDAADRGGATLAEIAQSFSVTREWIRQIEAAALKKLPRRTEHLREDIAEEPEVTLRPAHGGAARPVEDRRQIATPAQRAHLLGPADVTSAEQPMWCPWIGTAMTAGLCSKRHAARRLKTASQSAGPVYPGCASCTDGAAVAARVGAVGELVPLRVAVPAKAIDWMGDGEAEPENDSAPAAMGAEETTMATKGSTTRAAFTATGCPYPGCTRATHTPTTGRRTADPLLAQMCQEHRRRVRQTSCERVISVPAAMAWLSRDRSSPTVTKPGAVAKPAKAPVPYVIPSRGDPRDTTAALLEEQRAQIADLGRLLSESVAREAALRADLDALALERATRADAASPWARLQQLASVLREGCDTWWSVSGYAGAETDNADGHIVEAFDCDDDGEGTGDPLWSGHGPTPDEALTALVGALEADARAKVAALTAALEGGR